MTDHRAEAIERLAEAMDIWNEPRDYKDPPVNPLMVIAPALIGIGHALLAGLLEPVEREYIPATIRLGICPRCGRDDHPESAHEEAAARIAGRDTDTRCIERDRYSARCLDHVGHDGPHQYPPIPPLSVSEG